MVCTFLRLLCRYIPFLVILVGYEQRGAACVLIVLAMIMQVRMLYGICIYTYKLTLAHTHFQVRETCVVYVGAHVMKWI